MNLLAKPIAEVRTAVDFSSVMVAIRELNVLPAKPVALVGVDGAEPQRA